MRFLCCERLATIQVVIVQLQVLVLAKKGMEKKQLNGLIAERLWKPRMGEEREAQEEVDRKEEPELSP